MALEAPIIEVPFAQGQNEGTERAVLPLGQFSYLQNARYRKNQRLGKRNGYTSVSSLDADGDPLGSGEGRLACLGPDFCVVDDRFYARDQTTMAWQLPAESFSGGPVAGTRLTGRFPEFMPGPVIEPHQVQSDTDLGAYTGTTQASLGSMTYGLGLVWTCVAYFSVTYPDCWLVQVCGIDPVSKRIVFQKDLDPTFTLPATVRQQPVLLSTTDGNTIVLIYDRYTAGVKVGVRTLVLTSLTAGFGPEVDFPCLDSAANYDPSVSSGILFVYTTTAAPDVYTIARMNPATMVATDSATYAPGGAKTRLSCFGNSAGLVWVGRTDAVLGLRATAWDTALSVGVNTGDLTAVYGDAVGPFLFASTGATSVRAIMDSSDAYGGLCVIDVFSDGSTQGRMRQFSCKAISQPFTVDDRVYLWVRHYADAQLGVASLVRVPTPNADDEYTNTGVSPYMRSLPLNATLDDYDIDAPPAIGLSGPLFPTPVGTPLGYVALLNFTRDTIAAGGAVTEFRSFALTPVRHRSEGVRYSPSAVVPCVGKQFVASAQGMWVDAHGSHEAGFVQAPVIAVSNSAGVGALDPAKAYSYTAVYCSVDSTGNLERSAPSVPREVTGNDIYLITASVLGLSARVVKVEIYRAVNGSPYRLVAVIDAPPASVVQPYVSYIDGYADSDIEQNKTLYTQVGQELPASQFPACSFANVGGNRLWCAGGFHGNGWHASKLFVPRICAEFADDDAFRGSLSSDITGSAWCDNQVFFTQEGIYVVSGDGPDGAGVGFFTTSRLPFAIGCIDPRSVVTTDLGVFFQSARGLYLLPRGFGPPVAMDQVLDTLTTYPIITSARSDYSSRGGADNSEQVVQWTAVSDEAATSGVVITYDMSYKAFSVDTFSADYPATFQAGWSGDAVQAPALLTEGTGGATKWHPFRVRDTSYDDEGLSIDMRATTGDIRPWGTFAHGVVNRVGLLGGLRTACELEVKLTTDRGESHWKSRIYELVDGDAQSGDTIYLEAPLGQPEQRDITSLRVGMHEDSATEGAALFGLYIEHQKQNQGWRLLAPRDRVNVLADAIITESGADVITDEDGEQLRTEDGS